MRVQKTLRLLIVALVASSGACGQEQANPVTTNQNATENATVTAERVSDGVKITNGSTSSIEYVVVNPMWLGLLASCRSVECPTIAPGASVVVPESAIHGFAAGVSKLVVRYWSEVTSVEEPIEIDVTM